MSWFIKDIKGSKGTGKNRNLYQEKLSKDYLIKVNSFYMNMILFLNESNDENQKKMIISNILTRREYEMRDLILYFLKDISTENLLLITDKSSEIILNINEYIDEYHKKRYLTNS